MRQSTIARVVVVAVLISALGGAVVTPVAADTGPRPAQVAPGPPGPSTPGGSQDEADEADDGGGGETPPDPGIGYNPGDTTNASSNGSSGFLSPKSFAGGILAWVIDQGQQATKTGINYLRRIIHGMPAPGQYDDPWSWLSPQNGLWPGVFDATTYTMSLGTLLWTLGLCRAFWEQDPYERRARFKTLALSGAMIMGTWFVAPLGLHAGGRLSMAVAPSGAEFIANPGNLAKILSGGFFALVLIKFYLAVVVTGMMTLIAQYFAAHLVVAMWPVAWGARVFDGSLRTLGDFFIYLYGLLIGLNIGQAIILRVIFEMPWEHGTLGPLMGLIATVIGLAIALIYLPYESLQNASYAAAVGLGLSSLSRGKTSRHADTAAEKVGDVRSQFDEWRGGDSGSSSSASRSGSASGGMPGTDTPGVSSGRGVSRRRNVGGFGASDASANDSAPSRDRSRNGMYADSDVEREQGRVDYNNDRGFQ